MKIKTVIHTILPAFCVVIFFTNATAQTTSTDSLLAKKITNPTNEKYIGFAKQKEIYNVSSISTRKGSELSKAFTNNISNTFFGRFTGFTANQGGNEPGVNNSTLFIRGANTFGFSSAPLVLIDGFLGDYSELIPDEIEEISVLKDAAATAIYGMRAANGVVLINTKKGFNKPLTVNFGAQYGLQNPTSLPNFLNSYDYARLYNEALVNDGRAALYTQNDLNLYQNGSDPVFHPNVNWYDQVFRNSAALSNFNLNFKGGNNSVRFFAMLNALTSDGLYKKFGSNNAESSNSLYNRYNFRANVDVTLNKRFSAQLNIGGSVADKKNPGDLYANNTLGLIDRIAPNAFPIINPNGSWGGNTTYASNPVGNLTSTGFSTSNGTNLQSSLRLIHELDFITSGLSANVAVSFNNFYLGASNKRRDFVRFNVTQNALGDTVYSNPLGQKTSLTLQETVLSQFRNYAIQASLNYEKVIGQNNFSALLFFNSDNYNFDRQYPSTDAANQAFPYKTNSVAARIGYVNNERYIAELTITYMGAESFSKNNRNVFFPTLALGWVASNESFLKNNKTIDFLKIRASYGMVGNENIGGQRFAFAQRYPSIGSYFFGVGNAVAGSLVEARRANPNVTCEKERKANFGIDLNLAKHFSLVLDLFRNERYNILSSANGTLPLFLGYNGLPDLNIGKASTQGFELAVRYNNDTKKDFQFSVEGLVSYAKNTIDFNGEPFQLNNNLYRTGYAIDQPFGLLALGFFQNTAEIASSPKPIGINIKPGDIKYQDIGGPTGVPDGIIDNNDVTAIGKTQVPEWTFGLTTGFKYKNFDLNLMFQGVSGVTQYLGGSRYYAFQNDGQVNEMALARWTVQTASNATYPRLSTNGDQNNYRYSSFWQRDGSFIKLRVAELGYTLPSKLTKKLHLANTRLFLNGTNLFTLDKVDEGDVDALYGYPQIRTVSFGFKLQLQ